jgi:hypothetical protein
VRDQFNNPIAGVLVYLVGCGSPYGCGTAVTDAEGRFTFTRVRLTEPVQVELQKTGIVFADPMPFLVPGESPVISGSRTEFNRDQCDERLNSEEIHRVAERSQDLRDLISQVLLRMPQSSAAGRRVRVAAARHLRRYLEASQKVPEVTLSSCRGNSCAQATHRAALRVMLRQLEKLRNSGYFGSKVLYQRGEMTLYSRDMFDCEVKKVYFSARSALTQLPASTVRCE